jgi:hypothetical protein
MPSYLRPFSRSMVLLRIHGLFASGGMSSGCLSLAAASAAASYVGQGYDCGSAEEPLEAPVEAEGLGEGLAVPEAPVRSLAACPAASVRSFVVFPAALDDEDGADGDDGDDDGAGVLGAVPAPGSGAVDALGLGAGAGEVVAEGVGAGVDLPPPSRPPSRLPRSSSRFGSVFVGLGVGAGAVVGAVVVPDWGAAEAVGAVGAPDEPESEDPEDAVGSALGVDVPPEPVPPEAVPPEPEPSDALGEALGSGVAVDPLVLLALSLGAGVSDCVTQGPALNVVLLGELSSASARCGVRPMPISTAVGMAASATAFPAGTCSLVSSDLRGAA